MSILAMSTCPQCGKSVTTPALGGLCLNCVAQAAFAEEIAEPNPVADWPALDDQARVRHIDDYKTRGELARGS
jgi:hypothetical protein